MHHPFALELAELEALDLEIQDITNEEAEKVSGGASITTQALGEEGGVTTQALGEEGGVDPDAI
ncbi:MAG: hypothetical protein AB4426_10640 [Xenococcaceae cyanobacterium]